MGTGEFNAGGNLLVISGHSIREKFRVEKRKWREFCRSHKQKKPGTLYAFSSSSIFTSLMEAGLLFSRGFTFLDQINLKKVSESFLVQSALLGWLGG